MKEKITVDKLRVMKRKGDRITALTAYDYPFARLVDDAGVDIILVGDSLGMVFRGEENTLRVTIDEMAYHTKAVHNGVKRAFLVSDMPFLSCHLGVEKTIENAGRLISEGAEAVKIEGTTGAIENVERLIAAGIPVMGHIGLTPQSIHNLGGFKIQGRRHDTANKIIEDAMALAGAGVFAIVLECVPAGLAHSITQKLKIPTIGIGAGPDCDGQILVTNDILGMPAQFTPKFVKKYADLSGVIHEAITNFVDETKTSRFPDEEHSYISPQRPLKAI